jgi:hypothetical protein
MNDYKEGREYREIFWSVKTWGRGKDGRIMRNSH